MVLEGVLEDRWKVAPLIHRPAMELVTSAVLPLPPTSPLGGSQPKARSEASMSLYVSPTTAAPIMMMMTMMAACK
jgi:hypothetical protein